MFHQVITCQVKSANRGEKSVQRVSVDRIEAGWIELELENGNMQFVAIGKVPFPVVEGDILILGDNNEILGKDESEKQKRLARIRALREQIRMRR